MKRFFGLIILLVIAAVCGVWFMLNQKGTSDYSIPIPGKASTLTKVTGLAGSEKMELFADKEIMEILERKENLDIDVKKAGSVEMVRMTPRAQDFLWPANRVNLEYYQETHSDVMRSADIFNSPIVLYSWDIVTDALIKNAIVQQRDSIYYVIDLPKLLELITAKKTWKDIGLEQLYGKIMIRSTDPAKSNSGNMFAALIANTLNKGEMVTQESIKEVLPRLNTFFARLGHMEHSSSVLFNMFLQQGAGAYPIIVGYENQLLEFANAHEETLPLLTSKVRILYPFPTVWASHPFIALSKKGVKLMEALKNEKIYELAWKKHGFRSGLSGGKSDPSVFKIPGIPKEINGVMQTPSASVMNMITESLLPLSGIK
ncbi:conserved exported hypothetical protein [Desulfamplus magnetovallimortis]|uniref:Extracellular solute-binding protein n=1 Tax=Desulfamplus magnetovallimortis TaxID=1246637 RepID=A0A1W1HJM7_9BACT|nr:hypothetical protein [Desulfamplus magnetovallimortis]SLM32660.1 conserved exported hypothetical protein [Desulfamplus magnetovallimortis]